MVDKLSYSMAISNAKRGLGYGLVFGLTQDLLRLGSKWASDKRQELSPASNPSLKLGSTDDNT